MNYVPQGLYERGGVVRAGMRGNFSSWEISRCKFVRNFPHNLQAAVRNKLVSKFSKIAGHPTTTAKHGSACVDGVWPNSVGTKPLAVDHPFVAQLSTFLKVTVATHQEVTATTRK